MVSVIIPAFNEEAHIKEVVQAALGCRLASEVLVINDGSTDGTAEVALRAGARVIDMPANQGKAEAMEQGVRMASNEVILFLDADLVGLTSSHVEDIARPVASGRSDMFIGILSRKQFWLNKILHFFPLISGQRALTKDLWRMVPNKFRQGFQIELALNYYSRRTKKRSGFKLLTNIGHTTKEKKYGFLKGFAARIVMMWQIVSISFRLYIVRTIADGGSAIWKMIRPAEV